MIFTRTDYGILSCFAFNESYPGFRPHVTELHCECDEDVSASNCPKHRSEAVASGRTNPLAAIAEHVRHFGANERTKAALAELERQVAEVAELKRELNVEKVAHAHTARGLKAELRYREEDRQELEAEKAAHVEAVEYCATQKATIDAVAGALHGWPEDSRKTYVPDQLAARARRLFEAQKARAVPAKRTVLSALKVAVDDWSLREGDTRELPEVYADAALALFASPPASPDNTPPEPSTDRARLEAEGKKQCPVYFDLCTGCVVCDETLFDEEDALLSGQAKPIAPSPDASIEAVKAEVAELERRMTRRQRQAQDREGRLAALERDSHKPVDFEPVVAELRGRLDELEIQGRVVKRLCTDNSAVLNAKTWASIEREERERNK